MSVAPAIDPATLAWVWLGIGGVGLGATLLMLAAAWWSGRRRRAARPSGPSPVS